MEHSLNVLLYRVVYSVVEAGVTGFGTVTLIFVVLGVTVPKKPFRYKTTPPILTTRTKMSATTHPALPLSSRALGVFEIIVSAIDIYIST